MIDTKSFLLPDLKLPKGKGDPVAENRLTGISLPDPLKGIRCDPVASGSAHEIETNYEADEREAIQHENRYATRQSIPQAQMVAGLLKASRWQR